MNLSRARLKDASLLELPFQVQEFIRLLYLNENKSNHTIAIKPLTHINQERLGRYEKNELIIEYRHLIRSLPDPFQAWGAVANHQLNEKQKQLLKNIPAKYHEQIALDGNRIIRIRPERERYPPCRFKIMLSVEKLRSTIVD